MQAIQTKPKTVKRRASRHEAFAVRSQLLHWFHDQETRTLKALRKAYEASVNQKGGSR